LLWKKRKIVGNKKLKFWALNSENKKKSTKEQKLNFKEEYLS
jgi:hypothetical protein